MIPFFWCYREFFPLKFVLSPQTEFVTLLLLHILPYVTKGNFGRNIFSLTFSYSFSFSFSFSLVSALVKPGFQICKTGVLLFAKPGFQVC